jgi:hypothetical protein
VLQTPPGSTKAHFVGSLLHAACDVRNGLRRTFQERPLTKDIYIKVEKISKHGDPSRRSTELINCFISYVPNISYSLIYHTLSIGSNHSRGYI